MRINEVPYKVLLPRKFWKQANSKTELKMLIINYFNVNYPNYEIKKVIQIGDIYMAVCVRR